MTSELKRFLNRQESQHARTKQGNQDGRVGGPADPPRQRGRTVEDGKTSKREAMNNRATVFSNLPENQNEGFEWCSPARLVRERTSRVLGCLVHNIQFPATC